MVTDTPKKRGPGRPKGSKNKPKPEVIEIPGSCNGCGSMALLRVPGTKIHSHPHSGLYKGFIFSRIDFVTKKCKECGQIQVVRVYVPAKKNIKTNISETDNGI